MKKNHILSITFAVFISAIIGKTSIAQDMFKDNFSNNEQWRYIADDVMGGVSTGNVEYSIIEEDVIAVLKGKVSTENNGGFIQIRRDLKDVNLENGPLQVIPGSHKGPVLSHHHNGIFCGAINPDDPNFQREKIVTLTGKAGSMTVHHARTLHGSAPNQSDRPRLILFYEIAKADAWPILVATSYYHGLGQSKFWDDLQDRTIIGTPCVEPRVENVPVRMPLPPAKDASSIFKTQKSGGAKSAFM